MRCSRSGGVEGRRSSASARPRPSLSPRPPTSRTPTATTSMASARATTALTSTTAVQKAIDAAEGATGADYVVGLGASRHRRAVLSPWTSNEVIANTTGFDAVHRRPLPLHLLRRRSRTRPARTSSLSRPAPSSPTLGKLIIKRRRHHHPRERCHLHAVEGTIDGGHGRHSDRHRASSTALQKQVVATDER